MPEIFKDLLTCVVCDKGGDSIKKCSKCFSVSYCGRDCQVGDWARHKRLCVPVMVKDFGEKGRGLVASKNFKIGDIIFEDTSVASRIANDARSPSAKCEDIYSQISKLSKADQRDFYGLSRNVAMDDILSGPVFGNIPEKDSPTLQGPFSVLSALCHPMMLQKVLP